MARVVFSYDLEKDIENYLKSIWQVRRFSHGRKNYREMAGRYRFTEEYQSMLAAKDEKEARKIVKKIIKDLLVKNEEMYFLAKSSLKKVWRKKENNFFVLLEKFFDQPVYFEKATAFFTTLPVCPYNRREGWFMVSFRYGLEEQIKAICHELMHFMFLGHFWNYTYEALNQDAQKAEMIKEALIVFLNTKEFRGINTVCDQGYPQEKVLREHLLLIYRKKKDFQALLDGAIDFVKKT